MNKLITLEEYKLARGIGKQDQDPQLERLIEVASSLIQTYLKKSFGIGDGSDPTGPFEEIISLDYDTDVIYLDAYPISGPVTVTETDSSHWDSTVHLPIPSTNYFVDYVNGKVHRLRDHYWTKAPSVIVVSYHLGTNSGGGTQEVPAALKQATIDLVTYYHKEEYKDLKQLRGATLNNAGGGYSSRFNPPTQFPAHIQRVLDLYK